MRFADSLRLRLMIFYLLIFLVLAIIMITAMPLYYQRLLARDTQALTEGTLTSISRNIETYLDDLNRLTITPYLNDELMRALKLKASPDYESLDTFSRLTADRALRRTFPVFLQNSRRDILATVLIAGDGSIYLMSLDGATTTPIASYQVTEQDWYQKALDADGQVAFISAHEQDYLGADSDQQVFSVARLIKDPDTRRPLGVIMADADTVVLERIVSGIHFNVSSIVGIFDDQGKLLYANHPISAALQRQALSQSGIIEAKGESYVAVSQRIASSDWRVVVLLSEEEIAAKTRWSHVSALLFAGGGLLLTGMLFITLSHWITRPFERMIAVMRQVQTGDLNARFEVTGSDEIAELGGALNQMIEKLNELIDREYRAVISQRDAEYQALQSQIQPHFLYNTLNGLIGLNRLNDSAGLEKAIFALSGMLHYILEGGDWVRLEDEFEFIRKYCDLQLIRFRDRLTVGMGCDAAITDIRVPKLLLQPLVENAVIHGVEPLARPCTLSIRAALIEDAGRQIARITVKDDGAGFDAASLAEKEGLGLSNVRERMASGLRQACLSISGTVGGGTQVDIEIPILNGESIEADRAGRKTSLS